MSNVIKVNNVTISTSSSSNNVQTKTSNNAKTALQRNNDLPINVFIENVNNKVAILHIHGRLTYAYMQKLLRYIEQDVIQQLNHDMIAICTNLPPYYLQQITLLLNNYNYVVGYYDSSTSTMYFKNFSLIHASNYNEEVKGDE
jgi:beta-lactamase regulating signal transducer with metallopeptidase domain